MRPSKRTRAAAIAGPWLASAAIAAAALALERELRAGAARLPPRALGGQPAVVWALPRAPRGAAVLARGGGPKRIV